MAKDKLLLPKSPRRKNDLDSAFDVGGERRNEVRSAENARIDKQANVATSHQRRFKCAPNAAWRLLGTAVRYARILSLEIT